MRLWKTAAALAVGLILGGSAVAFGVDPAPPQYTGCLTRDGTLLRIAVGSSPKAACSKTETLISWNQVGPKGQPGEPGTPGGQGAPGEPGLSAYEVAVANGFEGTEAEWLAALKGATGEQGDPGAPGPASLDALAGSACSVDGKSGTLSVAIDKITGVVTLTCLPSAPANHTVKVALTSGQLELVQVMDDPIGGGGPEDPPPPVGTTFKECVDVAAECSVSVPDGTRIVVKLAAVWPFEYTCPGQSMQMSEGSVLDHTQRGSCATHDLAADYTVSVGATPRSTIVKAVLASGQLERIKLTDVYDPPTTFKECLDVTVECSVSAPGPTTVAVTLVDESSFAYTCPGLPSQVSAYNLGDGKYHGYCAAAEPVAEYTVAVEGF